MSLFQRPAVMAVLLLFTGVLIAVDQSLDLDDRQQAEKNARFQAAAQRIATELDRRMLSYEHGLRGARGVVITPGLSGITRAKFLEYSLSRDYGREFSGSRGFGFVRRVPEDQEAEFLAAAQQDGKPDFKIHQITPHSGDRLVIQYIEPEADNKEAVGLDIASEPNRYQAALESIYTNQPTLTHPITLVQATAKPHYGFLLLLPIYHSGWPVQTPDERLHAYGGLSYSPLLIDEVLAGFDLYNGQFAMRLYDEDSNAQTRFYQSQGADQPPAEHLLQKIPLTVYGRHWQIEVMALPPFIEELNLLNPKAIGWGLVGLSVLLAVFLYLYLKNRMRQRQHFLDQAHLAAIVESSNDAIISKTLEGLVTSWNKAAERIFGYTAEEAIGQPIATLIVPANLQGQEAEILLKIRKGQALPYFTTVRHRKDGSLLDVSVTLSPIYSTEGRVIGASKTVHDITEQKAAQHQLEQLNQVLRERTLQAEAANRTKSEFLANMSHEIRTPMNAILGLCYLLDKQSLSATPKDMVHKIQSAARSLLGIINDILDFSKIEAKRLDIRSTPFRLDTVLNNLASIMASSVGRKPIEVVIAPAPNGAEYLKGDAGRLEQILINLVGNALKFTEAGDVSLSISIQAPAPHQPQSLWLRFCVRDTGIGISKDKQALIFNAFSQVDGSNTRSFGGTGLGLTISRRLAELMGGTLTVSSELGQGSEFVLELPFESTPAFQTTPQEVQHQHVLVADDHPVARLALAETVNSLGWQADMVDSGAQAIELASLPNPPHATYDILLLDWRMPEVDGLTAAQRIRQQNAGNSPIIIMVTAYDREQLQAQPGSGAADVILTKPVTSASLYNAVLEAKRQRDQLTTVQPSSNPPRQRLYGVRVLVVDDSDINREVAEQILSGEGAQVQLAANGQEALTQLTAHPHQIDAVLMDIQMPVMDGYEATRKIRANPELHNLPIAALTAGAFNSQREAALQAGMNAFISKPFDVDELIEQVARLIPNAAQRGQFHIPSEEPDEAFVCAHPAKNTSRTMAHPINPERGLAIFKDPEKYKHSLRKFAAEYQNPPNTPETPPETLAAWLHKLKGTAGNLGFMALAQSATEAEQALKTSTQDEKLLKPIQEALNAVHAFIEDYAPEPCPTDPEPEKTPPPKTQLTPLLQQLMNALDTDNPDHMEPILKQLLSLLPSTHTQPIEQAIENFDFRGAETLVIKLAQQSGIQLEHCP